MKRLMVIGALAVFVAACGSDRAAAPTIPPAVTVSVADTAAATTTSPASPTTTTTSPTNTTPPATTTTTVATEDQIKQAVQDYFDAYVACGQAPSQCDPATFTASQGPSRSVVAEMASRMQQQGLYFSSELNGSYVVAQSVMMTADAEAAAMSCWYDAGTVLGPVGPDGNPTVVDDQVASHRFFFVLYLENDDWRVGSQDDGGRLGEEDLCRATP